MNGVIVATCRHSAFRDVQSIILSANIVNFVFHNCSPVVSALVVDGVATVGEALMMLSINSMALADAPLLPAHNANFASASTL